MSAPTASHVLRHGLVFRRPRRRKKYPHLSQIESDLWSLFLLDHGTYFDYVKYDAGVGQGCDLPDDLDEPYRSMATKLSQPRIDVLALQAELTFVIEIKEYAVSNTIGQVLCYSHLLSTTFPAFAPAIAAIVYSRIHPDAMKLADALKVHLFPVAGELVQSEAKKPS